MSYHQGQPSSSTSSAPSKDGSRISLPEWMEDIENEQTSRNQLNQIVLDYLINSGHKDAAVKFSKEANVTMDVDPEMMDDRMRVLDAAHQGKMGDCVKLLQDANPELLEQNMDRYLSVMKQMLLELIREKRISEALQFAQDVLAEKGAQDPALLEDFERALALLAFDKPEESPYGDLLDLARREEVKAQLNEAMLSFDGRIAESRLSVICKILLWSQDELRKRSIKFPELVDLTTGRITDAKNPEPSSTASQQRDLLSD